MKNRLLIVFVVAAVLGFGGQQAGAGTYQPWSDKVFTYIEEQYGQQALKRFRYLHDMIVNNQDLPVLEKLELVNRVMNHLPWIADQNHWKQADYWATPLETIATFGGDCEDIAIAKWAVLNHLGVHSDHLRLAYAKIRRTGESHMVLLYVAQPELPPGEQTAPVLVLDNYLDEVIEGPSRKDLLAVYVADADGAYALLNDDKGKRSIKGVFKDRKMKKLEDLKENIKKNQALFMELNDGRPLLPLPE